MRKVERDRIAAKEKAEADIVLAKEDYTKIASLGVSLKKQVRRFAVLYITKKYPNLRLKEVAFAVGYRCVDDVMRARRITDVSDNYAAFVDLMSKNGFEL